MIRQSDLNQFTGSESGFQHSLNRKVVYTEGIRYLSEQAEAYWLIDTIASHIGTKQHLASARCDPRINYLNFWNLQRNDTGGATLSARADSTDEPFIEHQIEFTDFPFEQFEIWVGYNGYHWTLYLPSEH